MSTASPAPGGVSECQQIFFYAFCASTLQQQLQQPEEDVVIHYNFSVSTVVVIWAAGLLIGTAVGSLGYLALWYALAVEPMTTMTMTTTATTVPPPPAPSTLQPLPLPLSLKPGQTPPTPKPRKLCYSKECRELADYYRSALNPLIQPCSNFGAYVCGLFREDMSSIYYKHWRRLTLALVQFALRVYQNPKAGKVLRNACLLIKECTDIRGQTWSAGPALQTFMQGLKLSLASPPSGAPTSADAVLALHVELAYTYGLSALLRMRPRDTSSLAVHFNGAGMQAALSRSSKTSDLMSLASITGTRGTPMLLATRMALYVRMKIAVANGHQRASARTATFTEKQVKDVTFTGVSRTAFGDAVASKTPYTRDARMLESPILVIMLESVWKDIGSSLELFFWTSWNVVDEVFPFVAPSEPYARARSGDEQDFWADCMRLVSHPMDPVVISQTAVGRHSNITRDLITTMTNVIATCLSFKTQWLTSFTVPPTLVISLPNLVFYGGINRFYASYPTPTGSAQSFFTDWVAACDKWRQLAAPVFPGFPGVPATYFDPVRMEVDVTVDGTITIPAALLQMPFFSEDGLAAANVGGLGHLIARSLVERYLKPGATFPAGCQGPNGTSADNDIENILAFECCMPALRALNASDDLQLPLLGQLSPDRMMFFSGCLKDCMSLPHASSHCYNLPHHLQSFRDAYSCGQSQNPCTFS